MIQKNQLERKEQRAPRGNMAAVAECGSERAFVRAGCRGGETLAAAAVSLRSDNMAAAAECGSERAFVRAGCGGGDVAAGVSLRSDNARASRRGGEAAADCGYVAIGANCGRATVAGFGRERYGVSI